LASEGFARNGFSFGSALQATPARPLDLAGVSYLETSISPLMTGFFFKFAYRDLRMTALG
jgi:hypothetical protein